MTTQLGRPAQDKAPTVLRVTGLTKAFEGVRALSGAAIEVRAGEIHALLGENGAGKSTMIRILSGLMTPDAGEIELDGSVVRFRTAHAAAEAGVVALQQEIAIVPTLSVAENIALGAPDTGVAGLVRWSEVRRIAREQLDRLGQRIPLSTLAGTLSPVQKTMVALARALARDARVLILDEPTAALTDSESAHLFDVLRGLRLEGVAILYVSHRLEEVFDLCDRYTVMRNGGTIETGDISTADVDEVIRAMVGREPGEMYPARSESIGHVVLRVEQLVGSRVAEVELTVRAGEIVGIGGLAGSGRSELLRLLAGLQRRRSGRVMVGERSLAREGVADALRAGIAYVPEERRSEGVDVHASIQDNIAAANLGSVSSFGWVSGAKVRELAVRSIGSFGIRARGPKQPVGELSGGNQQKIVLAKALANSPRVLLVDEPTRGIDVGARTELYRLIRELAVQGAAVVVVSSDLAELSGLVDRILVMREGRIVSEFLAAEADHETLLANFYGRAS
jgi:ABC-type sugar transport system ATPase subunit